MECVQDLIYEKNILELIGLKVEFMCINLICNWLPGGRTCHMETRMFWLRELKEEGLILTEWIAGESNPSDLFTKNLGGPPFE